ncbi:MAG: ABC transporter substrate-binding protein, partial [Lachnospirales bacterium]
MYIKIFVLICLLLSNKALAKPISLKDKAGQDFTFSNTARILSIASPAGSMVVAMAKNEEQRLVGTSPKSYKAMQEGVLNEFFPYLNTISSTFLSKENSINIESILQLKPDLVLQWAHDEKSIALLQEAGLNVVAMKYSKLDIAKIWLSDIAFLLDNSKKAKQVLQWHEEAYKKITAKTKEIALKNKPSVLYLVNEDLAAGSLSHFQFFMDTAGARNALNINK